MLCSEFKDKVGGWLCNYWYFQGHEVRIAMQTDSLFDVFFISIYTESILIILRQVVDIGILKWIFSFLHWHFLNLEFMTLMSVCLSSEPIFLWSIFKILITHYICQQKPLFPLGSHFYCLSCLAVVSLKITEQYLRCQCIPHR